MEMRKRQRNYESLRVVFFQIGLIVSMSVALFSFEWRTERWLAIEKEDFWVEPIEELVIPLTQRKVLELPEPIKPKITDVIKLVPDEEPVVDDDSKKEPVLTDSIDMTLFDSEPDDDLVEYIPMMAVEEKPIFPGCEGLDKEQAFLCFQKGIIKHIQDHFEYPEVAKSMGVQGTVYVTFVINTKGDVAQAKVERSIDRYLDAEALRLVNSLPKMIPAKQRNKPVSITYNVPIGFKIR